MPHSRLQHAQECRSGREGGPSRAGHNLVSIGDIARRAGRANESIRLLIRGDRGPGGFPAPTTRIGSGRSRVWRWAEVEQWFARYEKHPDVAGAESYATTIALVNDFLRMRTFPTRTDPAAVRVRETLERRLALIPRID